MDAVLVVFLAVLLLTFSSVRGKQPETFGLEIKEYCEDEVFFTPKCDESQVILIKHARYGRMHEKRCIPDAQGFLGCSMDARILVGNKCSGRRSCEVIIAKLPPKHNPPCGKGLRGYLEAAYECIDVIYPPRGYCRSGEVTEIRDQHGYLSSLVAEETSCGTSSSPWWISVKQGQRVRFNLHLFSGDTSHGLQTVFAILEEKSIKSSQPLTNQAPEMTTVGNRVKVTIMTEEGTGRDMENFLLGFEAIGCPDITPPVNGWARRVGDKVYMGCNGTHSHGQQTEWTIWCVEDKWTGNTQACTAIQHGERVPSAAAVNDKPDWNFLTESNALIITVGIGVAILIGLCLLVLGLVYICRMQRRPKRRPDRPKPRQCNRSHSKDCPRASDQFLHGQDPEGDYYCPTGGENFNNWQGGPNKHGKYPAKHGPSATDMPLPPPPYSPSRPLSAGSSNRWSKAGAEHVYERPTFTIPPSDHAAEGDTRSMSTSYNNAEQSSGECDQLNTL